MLGFHQGVNDEVFALVGYRAAYGRLHKLTSIT